MTVYKNDANIEALWLLEEASGTRVDDTPNNNDLTDNNTVAQSADAQEGSYSADFEAGNSESLSITDAAQTGLDIIGSISIVGWIKPETVDGTTRFVLAKWGAAGSRAYALGISYAVATGDVTFALSNDGTTITYCYAAGGSVVAGTWYHIAAVYNGTDMRVYIDGVLASNGANNPKTYSSGIYAGSADLYLGKRDGGTTYYDGLMDEVAVFSRALTADDVSFIYAYGIREFIEQSVAGTLISAGVVAKKTAKPVGGTLSSAGALVKSAQKTLVGTLASSGALTAQAQKVLAGTLISAGVVAKKTAKSLAGTLTSAGALTRSAQKSLAGELTSAGGLIKSVSVTLDGELISAGALVKETAKSVAGTLTSAGSLVRQTAITLTGTLNSSGALGTVRTFLVSLAGTLTGSGELSKQAQKSLSGTLSSNGALIKRVSKTLAGTLSSAGSLAATLSSIVTGMVALTLRARSIVWTLIDRAGLTLRNRDTDLTINENER